MNASSYDIGGVALDRLGTEFIAFEQLFSTF